MERFLTPIPIAVVGLGRAGVGRHIAALRRDRRFSVVGVIDPDPVRVAQARRLAHAEHGAVASGLEGIPWLDDVRAVAIATPPGSHARLVTEARARGMAVLVDTPLAAAPGDLRRLGRPGGPPIGVMHDLQFGRAARSLWRDLADGRLGEPRLVSLTVLANPRGRRAPWMEAIPLGALGEELPRLLSLLRRLSPDLGLDWAAAVPGHGGATPRLLDARWSGTVAGASVPLTLSMRSESPVEEWHLTVLGSDAAGIADLRRDLYLRLPDDHGDGLARTGLRVSAAHWGGWLASAARRTAGRPPAGVGDLVARFGDAVAEGHDPALAGRAEALAVAGMATAIIERAGRGRPGRDGQGAGRTA